MLPISIFALSFHRLPFQRKLIKQKLHDRLNRLLAIPSFWPYWVDMFELCDSFDKPQMYPWYELSISVITSKMNMNILQPFKTMTATLKI